MGGKRIVGVGGYGGTWVGDGVRQAHQKCCGASMSALPCTRQLRFASLHSLEPGRLIDIDTYAHQHPAGRENHLT
jgi:hypothetical protein